MRKVCFILEGSFGISLFFCKVIRKMVLYEGDSLDEVLLWSLNQQWFYSLRILPQSPTVPAPSRKEPLCYSCGKQPHLHNTLSLHAEGGGLRSKTEGECGTFKYAITIVYAFSLTRLCRELPPGRSLYVTLIEGNSLVGGTSLPAEGGGTRTRDGRRVRNI